MRKNKFRGLRKHIELENSHLDDVWVYGYLCVNGNYIEEEQGSYFVDNKTVGQYIGLKDMNKKEIYEGDIVTIVGEDGYYEIAYDEIEARYVLSELCDDHGLCFDFGHYNSYDIEVVGNIHENPELLEKTNAITRRVKFKEVFGHDPVDNRGTLVCPKCIDPTYKKSCGIDCDCCVDDYWKEEYTSPDK